MDAIIKFFASSDFLVSSIFAVGFTVTLAFLFKKAFPLLFEDDESRNGIRKKVRQSVQEKLEANISLTVQDIIDIGRGYGATVQTSIDSIYKILSETKDENDFNRIKNLIADINKKAPFEDLPEEVKPSMIRLSEICSEAESESDKNLLIPIQQSLSNYKTMRLDHDKMSTRSRISYTIAVISFFIGIVGIVLAFRTPSEEFIRTTITDFVKTQIEESISNK